MPDPVGSDPAMSDPVRSDPAMRVGVIGAGTMGAGITQVCAAAGHQVALFDVDPGALASGAARATAGIERAVQRGWMDPGNGATALAGLSAASSLEGAAAGAQLVIEAAVEDLELKRAIFRALSGVAAPDALLASNTSSLSISAIATATVRPERVLGLHFFNPAPLMTLVEVAAGERTTEATMAAAVGFVEGLGKHPVTCLDAPGFIVNRVNRPFTLEPLRMLEVGEATIVDIDAAIRAAGYPMGPFAYMDLVGLDVNLAAATAIWQGFAETERFRPSSIQQRLVAQGALGRKAGQGFYVYPSDGAGAEPSQPFAGEAPTGSLASHEIVERVELAIINEAYRAVGDGVALPTDIDLAMRLGANHPYGPFERVGQLGLRTAVERLARLQASHGDRYAIAPALWQIAYA
jgi:3-hydroxybutyryl-CoA dehydrogenase